MDKELLFLNVMNKTQILRPPRHTLATYGTTTLRYVFLSEIPNAENQCRLREGHVTAQRPQIITPDLWRKRFEGFGEETDIYRHLMDQAFGDAFRGLEYTFKNDLDRSSIESASLKEMAQRTLDVMNKEDAPRTALFQGPDATWGLSVMKFIVEMSLRSFPTNLREINEHDGFDPQKRIQLRTRARIEQLFREASRDPSLIKSLGETLKETGAFADYEDRFFALIRSTTH
jgi:hypothetical protein